MGAYQGGPLDALGDPRRRAILERLALRPQAVGELAAELPISRPAVSQHLRVLRAAGLVSDRAEGNRRIYRLDPEGLSALRGYLDGFETGKFASSSSLTVAVSADEPTGVAHALAGELEARGHTMIAHGALAAGERPDWAWASEAAARDVAEGRADQAIVCCWTGTGASIAANKVPGVRAALCADGPTADGARRWNDANVLALSLRSTSETLLGEILDAWFAGVPSEQAEDRANVTRLGEIEARPPRS